jgi:uncharacterized protein
MTQPDFPYHVDATGRTAQTGEAEHVRDLIEQVLFTSPGERVMRPDFGSGVMALVFEPNNVQLAATTQLLAQAALQQHLSHLIAMDALTVESADSRLVVTVAYRLLADGSSQRAQVVGPGSAG